MKKIAVLIVLIFMLGLPGQAFAAEPATGTVEGVVVNETHDGAPVPDQEVTLKTYLNNSETESKTAKTDANGRFSVAGLSTRSGYSYEATLKFQEADYTADRVDFKDGVLKKSVKVTVYDATTSDQYLKIQSSHTVVYAEEGRLLVKQYAVVENDSKLTYVGSRQLAPDKKETLRFTIPEGASELGYELDLMGCCVIPGDGIISDTMAVLPGTKEIMYSYRIPYESDSYVLNSMIDYPTQSYDLLVQSKTIGISGTNLTRMASVNIEGESFDRYGIQNAGTGDTVKIQLSGLPESTRQRNLRWILLGITVLAALWAVWYFTGRRKQHLKPQPVPVAAGEDLLRRKQRLVAELAQLDDQFEAGLTPRHVYEQQRAARKAALLSVLRQLKQSGTGG